MRKLQLSQLPTIRILFFVYNFVLMLIGFAYIGIGAWLISVLFTKPNFGFIRLYYTSMGAIMLTMGILTTILAFYGYIVSTKHKLYIVVVYLIATIVLLLFGIAVGVVGLTYGSYSSDKVAEIVNIDFFKLSDNEAQVSEIQKNYGCCGIIGPGDWTTLIGKTIPSSCCSPFTEQTSCKNYYSSGCYEIIKNSISIDMSGVGGVSLGIAVPILIGIAFSIGLIFEHREDQRDNIRYKVQS